MNPTQKAQPAETPASRKPFKVFVSSTFRDNQKRRKLVQNAITRAGMVWHGILYGGIGKNLKPSTVSR
jgi:hypothetical protein